MNKQNTTFVISVVAVIAATVFLCVSAFSCSGGKLTFEVSYYLVCYRITDNVISASSLSGAAASYGGAGYILFYNGNYYVTVSCYYDKNDAETVCSSLKRRDFECSVLAVELIDFSLPTKSAKRNEELYMGNFNTLNSLSHLAYECANGLDTGQYNQSKAEEVLAAINTGLDGLLRANENNCFTHTLQRLIAECNDRGNGYIYSKDMRYIQIAIIDTIVNAKLT